VLRVNGLRAIQKIEVGDTILDIALYGNTMYVSVDTKGKAWVVEYRHTNEGFTKVETDKWNAADTKQDTKAELYWLESMRKKIGGSEED
jgi:hypothetical protein